MSDSSALAPAAVATRSATRPRARTTFIPRLDSIIVWALLLTAPGWLPLVGSYLQLGSQILVFAITGMALNILLGYTGVISFGEAAYFGLGAYGCGLFLKFVARPR